MTRMDRCLVPTTAHQRDDNDRLGSMAPSGQTDQRAQLVALGVLGLVVVAVLGRSAPTIPSDIDAAAYLDTIEAVRSGLAYHPAVDGVFRGHGLGPVDSVLAIRSPIGFWLLAALGDTMAWIGFLVLVTAAALSIGAGLERPAYAMGVVAFFVTVGSVAWTAPELWAAVLVVAAIGLALQDHLVAAAMVATVATGLRELAVLALVGLLLHGLRSRTKWWPPVVGIATATGWYLWHWNRTLPYLVPDGAGHQAQLLGTSRGPQSVLAMTGTWLPLGLVTGPLLLVAALAWAHRRRRLALIAPVLALVVTGALVHRPEWAMFVVPVTLAVGTDELHRRVVDLRASTVAPVVENPEVAATAAPPRHESQVPSTSPRRWLGSGHDHLDQRDLRGR